MKMPFLLEPVPEEVSSERAPKKLENKKKSRKAEVRQREGERSLE